MGIKNKNHNKLSSNKFADKQSLVEYFAWKFEKFNQTPILVPCDKCVSPLSDSGAAATGGQGDFIDTLFLWY